MMSGRTLEMEKTISETDSSRKMMLSPAWFSDEVEEQEADRLIPGSPAAVNTMAPRPPPRITAAVVVKDKNETKRTSNAAQSKVESETVVPVPGLDAIQRQKIQQLRLLAANASRKQPGFRKENIGRFAYWLLRAALWLTAIFSFFVLLVAFPLAVDPAFDTLKRAFTTDPIICITTDVQIQHSRYRDGTVKNDDSCTWTSCRHGCTGELFRCVQLYANVSTIRWEVLEAANLTKQWIRMDSLPLSGNRSKRSTNWASNWATSWKKNSAIQQQSTKEKGGGRSSTGGATNNLLANTQRDFSRQQLVQLLGKLSNETGQVYYREEESLFAATNVRLMVNVRGCGYTIDCSQFNKTAGMIGSLLPCHLSSQGDYRVGVVDHQPDQDRAVILYFFTLPGSLLISATSILCFLEHYRKCLCCCRDKSSTVEFSAARLVINSGALGARLPSLRSHTSSKLGTEPNSYEPEPEPHPGSSLT